MVGKIKEDLKSLYVYVRSKSRAKVDIGLLLEN